MGMVCGFGQMDADMMDTIRIMCHMEKDSSLFLMVMSIMDIGLVGRHMDKEFILITMAINMKVNLYTIIKKDLAKKPGAMVLNILVCSKME